MPTLNFISKKVPVITRLKLSGNKCTFFLHLCQKKCQNTVEVISQSGYILAVSSQIGQNRHSKVSCSPRLGRNNESRYDKGMNDDGRKDEGRNDKEGAW